MVKSCEKWENVGKCGKKLGNVEKNPKWFYVAKWFYVVKWFYVASGERWRKVGKSG